MTIRREPQKPTTRSIKEVFTTPSADNVPWSVRVPEGLKEEAKIYAIRSHMTVGQLVAASVQKYMAENPQPNK